MNTENNYSFPLSSAIPKEEIEKNFWKCLYTSAAEQMLHYWIIMPKAIKPAELEPIAFPDVGLTNIGRYITADESPYLEVWAAYEHCPWEMNASDWLFNKLSMMGDKIVHQRVIGDMSGNGKFADVLTEKTLATGEQVISRYTVQKDYNPQKGGGNYFLMKASCSAADYSLLANTLYVVAVSWDLLHRSNLATAELLTTANMNNQGEFKTPLSWKTKPVAENRLIVEQTTGEINHGVINLYFYSRLLYSSAQDVYHQCVERFKDPAKGVTLTINNVERIENDFSNALNEAVYTTTGEIQSANENMRAFYQMYIFSTADLWFYAESVGKHMTHNDYHHEANKRCIELMLATLTPA